MIYDQLEIGDLVTYCSIEKSVTGIGFYLRIGLTKSDGMEVERLKWFASPEAAKGYARNL